MKKILIVCAANICRSPMAEGILKQLVKQNNLENEISVCSAGLYAFDGDEVEPNSVEVLKEIFIDISGHRSKRAVLDEIYNADCIYTMTDDQKEYILQNSPYDISYKIFVVDVANLVGEDLETFRLLRDKMIMYFENELTGEFYYCG